MQNILFYQMIFLIAVPVVITVQPIVQVAELSMIYIKHCSLVVKSEWVLISVKGDSSVALIPYLLMSFSTDIYSGHIISCVKKDKSFSKLLMRMPLCVLFCFAF